MIKQTCIPLWLVTAFILAISVGNFNKSGLWFMKIQFRFVMLMETECILFAGVRRERRWCCASSSVMADGNGDDSAARTRMHRFVHRCGSMVQRQVRLWPCADGRDKLLPPGRSCGVEGRQALLTHVPPRFSVGCQCLQRVYTYFYIAKV